MLLVNKNLNNDSDMLFLQLVKMITLLFFIKAIVLSFWITPFGDIPDEPDHFAYVKSIATDKKLPLLGEAKTIKFDAYGHYEDVKALNPIVQHPPLYHVFAAVTFEVFGWFTDKEDILLRSPRVVSALSGALTLLVLFGILNLNGINHVVSICAVTSVSMIPMYSNLSSGVSSEMSLLLFSSMAVFYWFKFYLTNNIQFAYVCAFLFSLAIVTKMTAIAIALPMLLILMVELKSPLKTRLRSMLVILMSVSFLPMLWFSRNLFYFGDMWVTRNSLPRWRNGLLDEPIQDGFTNYIGSYPVLENFFISFFGLFGYVGTKINEKSDYRGAVIHHISSEPLYIYSAVMFFLIALISFVYIGRLAKVATRSSVNCDDAKSLVELIRCKTCKYVSHKSVFYAIVFLSVVTALSAFYFIYSPSNIDTTSSIPGEMRHIIFSLVAGLCVISVAVVLLPLDSEESVVAYMWLIIGAFCAALLWKVFGGYLKAGEIVAIHGRYLFLLIPIFLVAACITISKFKSIPYVVILMIPLLFAYAEISTYIEQVAPFYKGIL